MARVLIVGCGCRGRALARELVADGHAVRGTTRDPARAAAIAEVGAEPYVGDPDRVGTITAALDAVTVLCWLLGSVEAGAADLHGPRWEAFLSKVVDTTVRGVVYEAAGTAEPDALTHGRAIAEIARRTWEIPLVLVDAPPADHAGWLGAMTGAVNRLLAG